MLVALVLIPSPCHPGSRHVPAHKTACGPCRGAPSHCIQMQVQDLNRDVGNAGGMAPTPQREESFPTFAHCQCHRPADPRAGDPRWHAQCPRLTDRKQPRPTRRAPPPLVSPSPPGAAQGARGFARSGGEGKAHVPARIPATLAPKNPNLRSICNLSHLGLSLVLRPFRPRFDRVLPPRQRRFSLVPGSFSS